MEREAFVSVLFCHGNLSTNQNRSITNSSVFTVARTRSCYHTHSLTHTLILRTKHGMCFVFDGIWRLHYNVKYHVQHMNKQTHTGHTPAQIHTHQCRIHTSTGTHTRARTHSVYCQVHIKLINKFQQEKNQKLQRMRKNAAIRKQQTRIHRTQHSYYCFDFTLHLTAVQWYRHISTWSECVNCMLKLVCFGRCVYLINRWIIHSNLLIGIGIKCDNVRFVWVWARVKIWIKPQCIDLFRIFHN